MKIGTVALIVTYSGPREEPVLVESLSDEQEIGTLELALRSAAGPDALEAVRLSRLRRVEEDEAFGDYVEGLLSQPFVPPQVREHGVQWFRSKNRIEKYQAAEQEARKVIADFAFEIFRLEPARTDFVLSSSSAEVRVRVFVIGSKPDTAVA
jgi:hypothetical protein